MAAAAPEASRAGAEVLAAGGNAFDAVVAAVFAMSVTRPDETGIGGGGFVLWHHAADGTQGALDGREVAPSAAHRDMYLDAAGQPTAESLDGPRAAGVPGLVALLARVHQGRGRLPWARLLQPAIRLAEEGFVVGPTLAKELEGRREVLARYPESAALFLPGGRPWQVGEWLRQPNLAATLRALAEGGPEAFYTGPIAEELSRACRAAGGLITPEDLAGYRVVEREPLRAEYRGSRVISFPPPSSGGALLIQMLNVMSGWDLQAWGWGSPRHLHALAETMRRAYADRSEHMGDPDHVPVPVEWLTSRERAEAIRSSIDLARATPSDRVKPGAPPAAPESPHTAHISVMDVEGNAVGLTHTINTGVGSGFVAGATGVLLNNQMDDFAAAPGAQNAFGLVQGEKNSIAPHKRPLSSMTPTLVLDEGGRVYLVLGSPGGSHIITAVLQVLSNVVDYGMDLDLATSVPRIHHQWWMEPPEPDRIEADPDLDPEAIRSLIGLGHVVRTEGLEVVGEVQGIQRLGDGEMLAVSDPRSEGQPAGY